MSSSQSTWAEFLAGWELFRDPVLAAAIAGVVLGVLSVYIVLRRMVFVSAAVTQGAGLGVALAFYAGIHLGADVHPSYTAVLMSLVTAAVLVPDPARIGLSRETVLGLMFAFTAGAAVLVGSRISQEAHDIQAILFGTGVLVMPEDLRNIQIAGAAVLLLHIWWFRGFTFASFDPVTARVQGLPVRMLDTALLLSIGVMVGVSARALGALPVFALSTLPGAVAVMVSRGYLVLTFVVAAVVGGAVGAGGYILAFFENYPVGGAQTVTASVLFGAAVLVRIAVHLIQAVTGARDPAQK